MLESNIQAKRKSDKRIVINEENEKCATLRLHKQRKSYNLEQKETFLRKLNAKMLKKSKIRKKVIFIVKNIMLWIASICFIICAFNINTVCDTVY